MISFKKPTIYRLIFRPERLNLFPYSKKTSSKEVSKKNKKSFEIIITNIFKLKKVEDNYIELKFLSEENLTEDYQKLKIGFGVGDDDGSY